MTGALWLDTNVILRYLLNDHLDHSKRALAVIESAERGEQVLHIPDYIMCESVYILESRNYTREQVCDALIRFMAIPGIHTEHLPQVQVALTWYRDSGVERAVASSFRRRFSPPQKSSPGNAPSTG